MVLSGVNFIGFTKSSKGKETFKKFSASQNQELPEEFFQATEEELMEAITLAGTAFPLYRNLSPHRRAEFLECITEEIILLGEQLVERCVAESGLSKSRINGEIQRTCFQLRFFAKLIRDGWYMDARIDTGKPDQKQVPYLDIRRIQIPIGPVAIFGASNFPLAFSTAGGDTASALAAGCPVIVKAHPSHPGTNELIAGAIIRSAEKTDMPNGVFSTLHLSDNHAIKLVQHPIIKAVGFTGSRKVGMMLFNTAVQRQEPIPVYAEMSSVNPVVLLENALVEKSDLIAKELAASITLGVGQFCTNPGLILLVESEATRSFLKKFGQEFSATSPGTMLNKNIYQVYQNRIEALQLEKGISILSKSVQQAEPNLNEGQPITFTIDADKFMDNNNLSNEVFGPASLLVICKNVLELQQVLKLLDGQLTATIHATADDNDDLLSIIQLLTQLSGRIIYGGYPTGVEVCHAMQHGGPFPSTTDSRSTSVGSAAINRFLRPIAFQNFPDSLLPAGIQNSNPLAILRLVNGEWTNKKLPNCI